MKKYIILISLCAFSLSSFAQLQSVVTDKANEAMGKYKPFILVDQATQLVLARNPIKYNPEAEMPCCYFTSIPASETGITIASDYRYLAINALPVVDGQHWVICQNKDSKTTIFSRRKFLSTLRTQYLWVPEVVGDYVMFRNLHGAYNINHGGFLVINEDGSFAEIKNRAGASKWKLIYAN